MTKREKESWQKRKDFSELGIDLKPWDGLNVEHHNSLKHEFVKFMLSRVLYDNDRDWDSEVRFPNGREADIVDLGPDDGEPVVYEVETNVTPQRKSEKLNHFHTGPVRDVIIIDPADVPDDPDDAYDYLQANEVA